MTERAASLSALLLILWIGACADSAEDAPEPLDSGERQDADIDGPEDAAHDGGDDSSVLDAAIDAATPDASAVEPQCPPGSMRQTTSFLLCPYRAVCFEVPNVVKKLACVKYPFTTDACTDAGGSVLLDSGDGEVLEQGCPDDASLFGTIERDDTTIGLCCGDIRRCSPSIVEPGASSCFEASWFWEGTGCRRFHSCHCVGPDCDELFASESECLAANSECLEVTRSCGVGSGGTCFADEYCAYGPYQECGAGDASAICQPRPTACDDVYEPVCGCDHQTYANGCEAARAGKGIFRLGTCESHEGYCTEPCTGFASNPSVKATCEAITDAWECIQHARGDRSPECRWTTPASSVCVTP